MSSSDNQLAGRLHTPNLPEHGGSFRLPEAAVAHARALRLRVGDSVGLCDGRGGVTQGRVLAASSADGWVLALDPKRVESRPGPGVCLVVGHAKGAKIDTIVRMTTELGVAAVHLAQCEHGVVQARATRGPGQLARWQRIAEEACAQSGQAYTPDIEAPAPLREIARRKPANSWGVVMWERSTRPLAEALPQPASAGANVWVIVGPEGGFSAGEIADLRDLGYVDASLGPAVLRVETAAATTVALLLHHLRTC